VQFENYEIRFYNERKYLLIGSEEQLYKSDTFYFYPTIAFYRGDDKSFGAYLVDSSCEEVIDNIRNEESCLLIPEGKYLYGYHKGPYSTIPESIKKIYDNNKNLDLGNETIHFNIIDQFVESNPENYVTSIQIRIL
jgi:effector-binding domain-containing protein